jgi:hypothetical protein
VAERRNSIADLRTLMGDIKEVCDKICGGAGDDTRSVKVNMGLKVFSVSEVGARETNAGYQNGGNNGGIGSINSKELKRKWSDGDGKTYVGEGQKHQNKNKETYVNAAQESPVCRYDKCGEKAFRHKKERGGHMHESGMCFDHFVEAVREGKKDKPGGVPLKGGKKMVLKRGENLKWNFKILSVKTEEENKSPIQEMLKLARTDGGEEERVFHTFLRNQDTLKKSMMNMIVESEGVFDLADLDEKEGYRNVRQDSWVQGEGTMWGETYPVISNTQ